MPPRVTKKGNTVKFHSLRTALVGSAIALSAAFLLGSCGGGGAASTGQGGNLILLPTSGATFYAGMPATFTIAGGHKPYRLASTDPGIFPVPNSTDENTLVVIPNNPGVIDNSITPGQLPLRTVSLQITDATNGFQQSQFTVAQNFLTGYGVSYTSNCAAVGTSTTIPTACGGGTTVAKIEPTFNGALIGFKTLRLDVIKGDFKWYNQDGTISGTDGHTITVTTDHEGKTNAFMHVDVGVQTQIAIYLITDVATGVSTEQIFTITGNPIASTLTILPATFSFTGATTADCGTGSAQFLVFDGIPPYKAISSFPQVTVQPATSTDQPGLFTLNVNDPNFCLTGATIIVTDSRLARGTVTIDTKVGTGAPPPTPLRVVPASFAGILCGQTVTALVTGGAGGAAVISAIQSSSNLVPGTLVAGNQVSVQANPVTGAATPQTATVTVTDGTSTATFTVKMPNVCS